MISSNSLSISVRSFSCIILLFVAAVSSRKVVAQGPTPCPAIQCSSIFVNGTEVSGTAPVSQNIVQNPDFETQPSGSTFGDLPDFEGDLADWNGWTAFAVSGVLPGVVIDESVNPGPGYYNIPSGEYAFIGFSWDGATSTSGIRQDIDVVSGVEYCVSFLMAPGGKFNTTTNSWIEVGRPGDGWDVNISGAATFLQQFTVDANDFNPTNGVVNPLEWTKQEFTFIATSTGTATIQFATVQQAGRAASFLDNVIISDCSTVEIEPCTNENCTDATYGVCSNGSTSVVLTCDNTKATNVVWYNSAGTQLGTGCEITLTNTNIGTGVAGQTECFYYEATDANSCSLISCCPVKVIVQDCCPTPNCGGVTVIKN